MNFFVKNFFILFFIVLVISITPGFAVKVGESFNYKDTELILSDIDKKTNELETLQNEINDHATRINDSVIYIKNNALKFWKYGKVLDHIKLILREANEVSALADSIAVVTNGIENDSVKLDDSLSEVKSNDTSSDKEFLKEVEKRSNTTFDITDPINFKQGDIVQYKGQMGNTKYLEYVKIDNKTSYIILQNSANKKIALSEEFFNKTATQKISPKTPNPHIINTINNLQLENINKTKNQARKSIQTAQKLIKAGDKLANTGFVIGCVGTSFIVIGAMLLVIGLLCEPLIVVGGFFMGIGTIFLVTGTPIVIIGSELQLTSQNEANDAAEDLKDSNALENDLSESLNSFPYAADVNLTTPAGASVNGTLNGTDFDDTKLTYNIVEQPKHGILKTSENGSFQYTPNKNFTGQESFKYNVNDGIVDSNTATVNITVLSNTKLIISDIKGKVGDRVNITATLQNNMGKGIANATVIFKINNTIIGKEKTNEKGIAILKNYILKDKGKFNLLVIFLGNQLYTTSNSTSLITIMSKK